MKTMTLGQYVRNKIMDNGCLHHSQCAYCGTANPIIFVWQANTDEFIEAAIEEWKKENTPPKTD